MFAISLLTCSMQLNCASKIGTSTWKELTGFIHHPLHIQAVTRETNDKRIPCALSANCSGATAVDGEHILTDVPPHRGWQDCAALHGPWLGCTHLTGAWVERGLHIPSRFRPSQRAVMLFPHCSSGSSFRTMLIFPSPSSQADMSPPPPHSRMAAFLQ